jgi:hypothetical protein
LIEEYLSSRSEIEKEGSSPSILTGVESITWSFPFAQSNSMIIFFKKSCTSCLISLFDSL